MAIQINYEDRMKYTGRIYEAILKAASDDDEEVEELKKRVKRAEEQAASKNKNTTTTVWWDGTKEHLELINDIFKIGNGMGLIDFDIKWKGSKYVKDPEPIDDYAMFDKTDFSNRKNNTDFSDFAF